MPVNENKETISQELLEKVETLGSDMIMHDVRADAQPIQEMRDAVEDARNETDAATTAQAVQGGVNAAQFMYRKTRPMVRNYNIRPNDPCPCGSGKKFKKCCKDSGKYEGYHTV